MRLLEPSPSGSCPASDALAGSSPYRFSQESGMPSPSVSWTAVVTNCTRTFSPVSPTVWVSVVPPVRGPPEAVTVTEPLVPTGMAKPPPGGGPGGPPPGGGPGGAGAGAGPAPPRGRGDPPGGGRGGRPGPPRRDRDHAPGQPLADVVEAVGDDGVAEDHADQEGPAAAG